MIEDSCQLEESLLPREEIEEFRRLILEKTGVSLTEAEAWTEAHDLIGLVRTLLGPLLEDPDNAQQPKEHQPALPQSQRAEGQIEQVQRPGRKPRQLSLRL